MSEQPTLMLLVQQLQQELQNQRIEIQSLRTDLNTSRSEVQQLQIQLLSTKPAPRSRLPDPPRFDGKPYSLRTWLPSIRAKLRSDQLVGADAFDYVWDRLEQPQQASVLHLRQSAEDSQSWDPEAIFSFFQRLCHNPREQQESIQRFSSVRQRDDESLIAYLARFERLAYEANATTWPDISRLVTLHRGLRPTLRQTLEESNDSLFSLPYDDYIDLIQRVDRRTRRPQPAQTPTQKPFPLYKPPTQTQKPDQDNMDLAPIQIGALRTGSPLSRSDSPVSTKSASSDRTIYRLENDLCFYCGSADHWISACPSRPTRTNTVVRRPTTNI